MDETRKTRMDIVDACHKKWECRSMEIELAQASAKLVEQQNEIERLKAALTPSAETKAAYWGEFSFSLCVGEEDGEEMFERITVPWTTVKEIMAAILARAELEGK
jgi:hypothetical protein